MLMIGQKFPTCTTSAVLPDGTIKNDFVIQDYAKGKLCFVFFYPLDFTFVCPTELVAFHKAAAEFDKRGCKLVAISVDSVYSHNAWRKTPLAQGGIGEVDYPMVSDLKREISTQLGILTPGAVTYRASYLLDQDGVVRHCTINDLPLGRNVEEALRMVDALKFFQDNGEVCPANWKQGEKAIKTTSESVGQYLASQH